LGQRWFPEEETPREEQNKNRTQNGRGVEMDFLSLRGNWKDQSIRIGSQEAIVITKGRGGSRRVRGRDTSSKRRLSGMATQHPSKEETSRINKDVPPRRNTGHDHPKGDMSGGREKGRK